MHLPHLLIFGLLTACSSSEPSDTEPFDCDPGFWGEACETPCAQGNCLGEVSCEPVDGGGRECLECSEGFSGLDCSEPEEGWYPLDEVLTLSDVQAKGTHNSYHIEPDFAFDASHEYTHLPLNEQLADQGVRQFEIDVHYHQEDGFQVFHIPVIDQETTCLQLSDCLQVIKDWSDSNQLHMPIMVWFELKDDVDSLVPELDTLEGRYLELEELVLSVWPRERILTPDEVRGDFSTLSEAVKTVGWPTLGALRGRIVFSLLESGAHRDSYLEGAPSLEERLLFVGASSGQDDYAAMFKINDAQSGSAYVSSLVEDGFIVTCNTDGADNSDEHNSQKLADSLASGVNFLSSDVPGPVEGRSYWFDMPEGAPARCNPVHAPAECTSEDIERLP
jgi:hypothetical protein